MLVLLRTLFLALSCFSLPLLASSFSTNSSTGFAAETHFLPVEQAYQADLLFNNGEWFLVWQLADGYFLYQHGFKQEWLINGATKAIANQLPDGIKKTDEYFGDVEIFYQQVMMPIHLPADVSSTHSILFKTTVQGCADAGLCYPPYSVYFSINLLTHKSTSIDAKHYQQALNPSASTLADRPKNVDTSLWLIVLWALLGGFILNLMPCVLPVLSIKILQLARHPNSITAKKESLAYLAGVLITFITIAAVMLALRASGNAIGWGFQLQHPWFIAGLVYLFFILGLSMSGLISFGHRWMGMGQSLTEKGGLQGAFFTGMLAVVVASPCTGPFMSVALGYALTQPTLITLLIFAALGLGMALPILLASFIPQVGRWMPKPGLWMETLKQAFAFPLYASAIWLLWVYGNQTTTLSMALLLLGCLMIMMAIWSAKLPPIIAKLLAIFAIILALYMPFTAEKTLTSKTLADDKVAYSAATLKQLRQQGKPIFIDLTADWCITCIANEKGTLQSASVKAAFKQAGVIYMVGDWTDYNPEITQLLNHYQRSGIPLYLLYPSNPNQDAIILPQLLTPSIVLSYLSKIDK